MSQRVVSLSLLLALALLLLNPSAHALTNGLALTPPMGFNSFYNYGPGGANEALLKSVADTMATNGMLAAGYQYINIDDGWAGFRDTNGTIVADTNKFPDGMKAFADYLHARGFKLGLYTTAGTNTCAEYPASANHFIQDANTYAAWGVDYLKYEDCDVTPYEARPREQIYCARMLHALAQCGRPIVFSSSTGAFENWMPHYINLFRGTGDENETWANILVHIDYVAQSAAFAGPGQWNDADVLQIGSGFFTDDEYTSIFSMWCMLASPLLNMTGGNLHTNILCNREAIAVDQDPAGIQGTCVLTNGNLQVWRKFLGSNNSTTMAVTLFNRGGTNADITANWSDLGLPPGIGFVRNIWSNAYAGNFTNSYTAHIPLHGVQMLKLGYGLSVPQPARGTTYLSTLKWLADITNQFDLLGEVPIELNFSAANTPLKLHGVTYASGLGMGAYTRANYYLGGAATRFQSDIGVDDFVAPYGSVICRVYADGVKLYDSGIVSNGTPTQTISVDVTGKEILTLEADNHFPGAQNGYLDWANARLTVPPPTPRFNAIASHNNTLSLSGAGGPHNAPYYLLTTTNPALPIIQWTRIATNYFDASGNFAGTNVFTPNSSSAYFLLQTP